MSRRDRYPYLERCGALRAGGPAKECAGCDRPATHFVVVRSGPFRGSDMDDYDACQRHMSMAQQNLDRFFGHVRSKGRFVAQKRSAS